MRQLTSLDAQFLAIENGRNLGFIYLNRGQTYYERKDYERAAADYTRAIEVDPNYPMGYGNRANAYAMKGEWLRSKLGLADRAQTLAFIEDAWLHVEQRDRMVSHGSASARHKSTQRGGCGYAQPTRFGGEGYPTTRHTCCIAAAATATAIHHSGSRTRSERGRTCRRHRVRDRRPA